MEPTIESVTAELKKVQEELELTKEELAKVRSEWDKLCQGRRKHNRQKAKRQAKAMTTLTEDELDTVLALREGRASVVPRSTNA